MKLFTTLLLTAAVAFARRDGDKKKPSPVRKLFCQQLDENITLDLMYKSKLPNERNGEGAFDVIDGEIYGTSELYTANLKDSCDAEGIVLVPDLFFADGEGLLDDVDVMIMYDTALG